MLIAAAGRGERLGTPKALLEIDGRSLLDRVIERVATVSDDVIAAVPSPSLEAIEKKYPGCRFIPGGPTRQDTIGALLANTDRTWILVHDVARPFASEALFRAVAFAATEAGGACAIVPLAMPVAVIAAGRVVALHSSAEAGLCATPLAFRRDILLAAYEKATREGRQQLSTVDLVVGAGFEVRAVSGERDNIKITYPEDLDLARLIAART